MEPAILKKSDCEATPYLVWNSFIAIVASDTDGMTETQRKAALCFKLESDVMNGGFYQYFENTRSNGFDDYQSVIDALRWIGGDQQAELFAQAHTLWDGIDDLDKEASEEHAAALERLNGEYDACIPSMNALFEKLLQEKQSEFVLIKE